MSATAARQVDGPTILDRLRADTRANHDEIEQALDWRRRVATVEGYRALLSRWWGFYGAVEPRLVAAFHDAGELAFIAPRRKLPALRQDLVHLGLTEPEVDGLPMCSWQGPFGGLSGALGTVYVLEGATLGGQIVARHVRALHGWSEKGAGTAFYETGENGLSVGAAWRATKDRLIAGGGEVSDLMIVASAKTTFREVHAWLCEPPS